MDPGEREELRSWGPQWSRKVCAVERQDEKAQRKECCVQKVGTLELKMLAVKGLRGRPGLRCGHGSQSGVAVEDFGVEDIKVI